MAEAMDVSPLPAAEVGPGAVEQGQRGGDVVLPPLLVGHLDGPPIVEPLEFLPLPLGLGPGLLLRDARARGRVGLASGAVRQVSLLFGFGLGGLRRIPCPFRGPPLPHGRTPQPAEQHRQQPERVRGGQRRLPPRPLRHALQPRHRPRRDRLAGQESAQVGRQGRGAGVASARFLLQALQADRLQVARNRRIEPPRRDGLVAQDLEHRVHRRGRLERRPAGEQSVQRRAQGVHVGRRPDLASLAAGLLRRHVAGRAHDLARAGQPAVALDLLRQPEVGDPRVALLVEQDVARLQVAVNHAALVGILDRVGHRGHQRGRLAGRKRPARPAAGTGSGPRRSPSRSSAAPRAGRPRRSGRCRGDRDWPRPRPRCGSA